MCPGVTKQAEDPGVAHQRQGTIPPTFLNLAQRRRRAGSRIPTGFDSEANSGSEHSHGCLPLRGALFGLNCFGTRSPTNDTTEVPAGHIPFKGLYLMYDASYDQVIYEQSAYLKTFDLG